MEPLYYSLVAYVSNSVGQFVENLRRELQPEQGHLPAHITVLPPRRLNGLEQDAIELIQRVCRSVEPFEIGLGEAETFLPVTPTVFLRVAQGAYRMRELHDRLNTGALHFNEPWPYMPHVTILRVDAADRAASALDVARRRWSEYRETRRITVDRLTFVRQQEVGWLDIAPVMLGRHSSQLSALTTPRC
jgi:2'-5' RNA ligase